MLLVLSNANSNDLLGAGEHRFDFWGDFLVPLRGREREEPSFAAFVIEVRL